MNKLLIVNHHDALLSQLVHYYRRTKFDVQVTATNTAACQIATRQPGQFELIILDWQPTVTETLVQLRQLRQLAPTPLMLLAPTADTAQKIAALSAGADDFVIEPLTFVELVTRVQVLLRRQNDSSQRMTKYQYSELVIESQTRQVWYASVPVSLTQREYQLLLVLVQHAEIQLSRTELLAAAWGVDFTGQPNLIDVYIRYLRRKLSRVTSHPLIRTIRGVGYCLKV